MRLDFVLLDPVFLTGISPIDMPKTAGSEKDQTALLVAFVHNLFPFLGRALPAFGWWEGAEQKGGSRPRRAAHWIPFARRGTAQCTISHTVPVTACLMTNRVWPFGNSRSTRTSPRGLSSSVMIRLIRRCISSYVTSPLRRRSSTSLRATRTLSGNTPPGIFGPDEVFGVACIAERNRSRSHFYR